MNMLKEKEESVAESQKQRNRQFEGQRKDITSKRRMLSIEDAPPAIRELEGRTLSELPAWLGNAIFRAIQQLTENSHAEGDSIESVQILIEAIVGRKNKLTAVAQEGGGGKLQLRQNEWGRERGRRKRYDFLNQIWAECNSKSLREYRIRGHIFISMLSQR